MSTAQAEAKEDSTGAGTGDSSYGEKGDSRYQVANSVCLLQPLSKANSDFNGILPPRNTVWPWAEEPEEFFYIAETDLNKKSRIDRIWSKSMLIANGLKMFEGGVYAQPKEPKAILPLMTLCTFVEDRRRNFEEKFLGELILHDTLLIEEQDAGILRDLLKERKQKDCGNSRSTDDGTKPITDVPKIEAEAPPSTEVGEEEDDKKRNHKMDKGKEKEKEGETMEIPDVIQKLYFQNKPKLLSASDGPDINESRPSVFTITVMPLPREEGTSVHVKFFPGDIEGWMSVKQISDQMDALAVQVLRPKLEEFIPDENLPEDRAPKDPVSDRSGLPNLAGSLGSDH